jgi:hypothetical protein
MFKRRRFPFEIILVCMCSYCKYGISYRELAEMMQERGVEVDRSGPRGGSIRLVFAANEVSSESRFIP